MVTTTILSPSQWSLFRTLDGPYKIVHVSRNLLARFHTEGVDRFYSERSQNDRRDVTYCNVKRFLWKRVAFERGSKFNRKNAYFSTKNVLFQRSLRPNRFTFIHNFNTAEKSFTYWVVRFVNNFWIICLLLWQREKSIIFVVSRNLLAEFHAWGMGQFCSWWSQNDRHDVYVCVVKLLSRNDTAFECGC